MDAGPRAFLTRPLSAACISASVPRTKATSARIRGPDRSPAGHRSDPRSPCAILGRSEINEDNARRRPRRADDNRTTADGDGDDGDDGGERLRPAKTAQTMKTTKTAQTAKTTAKTTTKTTARTLCVSFCYNLGARNDDGWEVVKRGRRERHDPSGDKGRGDLGPDPLGGPPKDAVTSMFGLSASNSTSLANCRRNTTNERRFHVGKAVPGSELCERRGQNCTSWCGESDNASPGGPGWTPMWLLRDPLPVGHRTRRQDGLLLRTPPDDPSW